MPDRRLREFLDRNGVKYVTVRHSPAYTAQEIAASAHVPGKQLAKTVMVRLDGVMAMAVLAAPEHVDLEHLKERAGAHAAELAGEAEFKSLFPDCELGAMPPFGNLWNMTVFVSPTLREDQEIAFNAGTHTELVRMSYADFERLVSPVPLDFAVHS